MRELDARQTELFAKRLLNKARSAVGYKIGKKYYFTCPNCNNQAFAKRYYDYEGKASVVKLSCVCLHCGVSAREKEGATK